jgi:TorA maturation chaperone TorD
MATSQGTDMKENASQRSIIYGFLAMVYQKELTPELLRQIKDPQLKGVLSDLGVKIGDEFFTRPEEELLEELAVEYTRLFLGPGKHISPHESIHHERGDADWGRHWGADTVKFKKFVETLGLKFKDENRLTRIPDHISVEFEMMQKVIEKEAEEWEKGSKEGALYILKAEKMFIEDHLIQWIPQFCEKVISVAEQSFYREMAKITKSFVEYEKENIDTYIAEAQP